MKIHKIRKNQSSSGETYVLIGHEEDIFFFYQFNTSSFRLLGTSDGIIDGNHLGHIICETELSKPLMYMVSRIIDDTEYERMLYMMEVYFKARAC